MRFTTVARIGDGLPLVSTMESVQEEDEISTHKKLAKAILRTLQPDYDYGPGIAGAYKATVLAGDYTFHYSVESGVVFLCLCEKAYPRLLAFSYLSELQKAFFEDVAASSGGSSTGGGAGKAIMSASRPYAFIKFEPIIQSTKRRYLNTRSLRTTEDLLDMSSRIQTFPVMQASELLGPEYYKIMASPNTNTAKTALNDAVQTALGVGQSPAARASPATRALIFLSVVLFIVDAFYFASWLLAAVSSSSKSNQHESFPEPTNSGAGFGGFLALVVGVTSPLLLIQSYALTKHGAVPPRLADSSTIHAFIILIQLLHAWSCATYISSPPPAISIPTPALSPTPSPFQGSNPSPRLFQRDLPDPQVSAVSTLAIREKSPLGSSDGSSSSPIADAIVPSPGAVPQDPSSPLLEPSPETQVVPRSEDSNDKVQTTSERKGWATGSCAWSLGFWLSALKALYLVALGMLHGPSFMRRITKRSKTRGHRD